MVRDARSLEVATSQLGCRAVLCPDLAFCLARGAEPALQALRAGPRSDVLRLYRTDHESGRESVRGTTAVDWVDDVSPWRRFASSHAGLARQRLRRGVRLLQSARVVVTDRLHGHVLALLLGIPHVVLGDRNGKLRAFIEAWTASAAHLRLANSPAEADRLAGELL